MIDLILWMFGDVESEASKTVIDLQFTLSGLEPVSITSEQEVETQVNDCHAVLIEGE